MTGTEAYFFKPDSITFPSVFREGGWKRLYIDFASGSQSSVHTTKHIVLLTLHHISTDKWSMGVLRSEWARYYKSLCVNQPVSNPLITIQYSDFTYWQQNQKIDEAQLKYWRNKLFGQIVVDLCLFP